MEEQPYAAVEGGVRLVVRVMPRSSQNGIQGVLTDADGRVSLKVRLTAPPHDGEANEALIVFLAKILRMRKTDISIHSGQTSRFKVVHLAGSSTAIIARLKG